MNHLDLEEKEQVFFQQHLGNKEPKKEVHAFCLHLQALLNSNKYLAVQHLFTEVHQHQYLFQALYLLSKDLQQQQYLIKVI